MRHPRVLAIWSVMVMVGVLAAGAPRAEACSLAPLVEHEILEEERAVDTTPPEAVQGMTVSIKRGVGPTSSGCSQMASSCDDLGWIQLDPVGATDDRTEPAQLGFIIEKTAGTLPSGMRLPEGPVRAFEGLTLSWIDGATDDQEGFNFTLDVMPVDLAGNVGEAFSVRIRNAPEDMACTVGRMNNNSGLVWALLVVGLVALRRRWSVTG